MKVQVKTLSAKDAGEIELSDAVFGAEPRLDILHRVVTWQLEKRRGTARGARERSDVARTGKKLGNQKGGGTARHGNRGAPQFIGGGKAHGPRVRDFDPGLNKKIRRLGLATALSVKAAEGKLIILEDLAIGEAKTKAFITVLERSRHHQRPVHRRCRSEHRVPQRFGERSAHRRAAGHRRQRL